MACITLLSDFGLQDASVAIAKGVLMQHVPGTSIIDISHDVTPFQTRQAAYLFASVYKNFPAGTFHVLLFDLFSDNTPRLIVCKHGNQFFLTPDNGLLPLALDKKPVNTWLCYEMAKNNSFTDWLHAAGKLISHMQEDSIVIEDLPPYELKETLQNIYPTVTAGEIACEVIHIDHYENVVINLSKHQFDEVGKGRPFRLQFMQVEEITELSNNYQDVRTGYKLCRFNSNGYMEICVNKGNAASLFGLRLGGKNNAIKIFFE